MKTRGFTLVEVLVTISILSILAGITLYAVNTVRVRSRDNQRITDLNRVQAAIVQYFTVNKTYPTGAYSNLDGTNMLVPTYLPSLPSDPTGGTYYYNADVDNFALWAKMEADNGKAKNVNDKGNCDNYYETGVGDDWASKSILSSNCNL